jgi:hypothetical protein
MTRPVVFFIILSLVFALFSGCVSAPPLKHENEIPVPTLKEETVKTIPEEFQDYWITIDSISDKTASEMYYTISGKTNLNTSDEILIQVMPEWWSDVKKRSQCGGREIEGQAATGTIHPISGNKTVNTWNFLIDFSTFPSQKYVILADEVNHTASARLVFFISGNNSKQGISGCH